MQKERLKSFFTCVLLVVQRLYRKYECAYLVGEDLVGEGFTHRVKGHSSTYVTVSRSFIDEL